MNPTKVLMGTPGLNRQRAQSVNEALQLIGHAKKRLNEALVQHEVVTQSLQETVEAFRAVVDADRASLGLHNVRPR